MRNYALTVTFMVASFVFTGCAKDAVPPATPADQPPEAATQPPPPVPPPTAGVVYVPGVPKEAPLPGFYAEINGVPLKLSGGETIQTEEDRMLPLYNFEAKSDCSDSKVESLIARPGPVCVVWFAPHELGMKSGESRSAKWSVGGSEVAFTVKVK
ncbi:hypothetical protein IT411_03330 [Candidatus Peregrinibacteria bacterium]|nr:hypothetical protein [Candidatus Peregrinibacteria bacterium]